ncbi:MAG: hypothetical protein EP343_07205 [Deltaproteobacteria bacterium]|nr:MAG: hypothetical protein EP343_07205 [Deltaproteobacteria bacterium]
MKRIGFLGLLFVGMLLVGVWGGACSDPGTNTQDGVSNQETTLEGGGSQESNTVSDGEASPETVAQEEGKETAPPEASAGLPALSNPTILEPGKGLTKIQIQPAVAFGNDGKLALVWTGSDESKSLNIYASIVDEAGKTSTPVRLDTFQGGLKNEPSVCALKGGGFVAVWSVDTQVQGTPEGNLQVRFRRLDATGKTLDSEAVQVKTEVVGNHWLADVACSEDGGFVFTGVRVDADNTTFGVFVQRFDADGKAKDKATYVNPAPAGTQAHPEVAAGPMGAAVVAYEDSLDGKDTVVFRLYPKEGQAPGSPVILGGGAGSLSLKGAVVAMQPDTGIFVVGGLRGNGSTPSLKQYAADGTNPTTLSLPPASLTVQLAVEALFPEKAWGVLTMTRSGTTSTLHLHVLGEELKAPLSASLASGSLPPYRPALAYRNGNLVVAWTERTANSGYGVKLAWFK